MTCLLRRLVLACLCIGLFAQLGAPARGEDEVPAALRKAWEEREAQAAKVEMKFKGTVTYVAPVEDDDGTEHKLTEPLPRAGTLLLDGTKLRLDETGKWPGPHDKRRQEIVWNGTFQWRWTEQNGVTSGVLSKKMQTTKDFVGYLQPLGWAVRPTTSLFGQRGAIHKLSVGEAMLPKVAGKCYLLTEEPLGLGSHVRWWIHQESATVRQVERLFRDQRTVYTLDYDLKDSPAIPSRWTETRYTPEGDVETRSEVKIDSISFPKTIDAAYFELQLKPGLKFVDTTAGRPQVFEIDKEGKRVPLKGVVMP